VGRGQLTRPVWRLHRGDVAAPTTPRSLSGDEVRAIRKGLKLTLALAGAAVGVSPGTFHDWEKRGSQEISRVHADGLEDKLKAAATKAVSAESKIRERCEQDRPRKRSGVAPAGADGFAELRHA